MEEKSRKGRKGKRGKGEEKENQGKEEIERKVGDRIGVEWKGSREEGGK